MPKDNIARHMLGDTPRQRRDGGGERIARPPQEPPAPSVAPVEPVPGAPSARPAAGKEQTVVKVVGPLAGELKDTVWWLRQHVSPAATIAGIVEHAIRRELEELKQRHNEGRSFPPRTGELPRGRPIAS
jgi:hypothetical protein